MNRMLYALWLLTLVVLAWVATVVSAFLAGRGKIWLDSEAGIIED